MGSANLSCSSRADADIAPKIITPGCNETFTCKRIQIDIKTKVDHCFCCAGVLHSQREQISIVYAVSRIYNRQWIRGLKTVATDSLLLFQVTDLSDAFSGDALALKVIVCPANKTTVLFLEGVSLVTG